MLNTIYYVLLSYHLPRLRDKRLVAGLQLARELLADTVVERTVVGELGEEHLNRLSGDSSQLVHVLLKEVIKFEVVFNFHHRADGLLAPSRISCCSRRKQSCRSVVFVGKMGRVKIG